MESLRELRRDLMTNRTQYKTVTMDDFDGGGEIIRVHDDHSDLMITHRYAAQDKRLQWKDRGLLWYLLSKPKDWQVRLEDLIASSPGGREEVQGILSRLQRLGYMERCRVRNSRGTYVGWMSKVSARPIFADPTLEAMLDVPVEAPEQPQEQPKEEGASSKWHPDLDRLIRAWCGTKEFDYKNGWVGYKPTEFVASRAAANAMLKEGYSYEQIEACYRHMKGTQFWSDKPLGLHGVRKNIGEYIKRHAPRTGPTEAFEPEGLQLEMM
jgi:hypothetical protein